MIKDKKIGGKPKVNGVNKVNGAKTSLWIENTRKVSEIVKVKKRFLSLKKVIILVFVLIITE